MCTKLHNLDDLFDRLHKQLILTPAGQALSPRPIIVPAAAQARRLLVVEDEPLIAMAMADQLERRRFFRTRIAKSRRREGMCPMPRYYFHVTNKRPFEDIDGLELSDLEEVREEAAGLARDLMRMESSRRDWSHWAVRVTDEATKPVLNLAFADADQKWGSNVCR
jgi:hypothetical protein